MPKKVKEAVERRDGNLVVRKTIKVPVHYAATGSKIHILDRLTARLTYGISLINELVVEDTNLDRITMRKLVKDSDIVEKTGLSYGFRDQCIDKVIWSWRSYDDRHAEWQWSYDRAMEKLVAARDDEDNKEALARVEKLLKREPSTPMFRHKTPCRLDYRTGRIQKGENSFPLWMHVSTLKLGETIDIPLNPSFWHMKQLEEWTVKDFEIVKKNGKYHAHISLEREVQEKQAISISGMDQGLNRTMATVLLPSKDGDMSRGELIRNSLEEQVQKYDDIVTSLQREKKWRKLRQLRHKRADVTLNHDFHLARQVAEETDGYYAGIGNTQFRQSQYRGNRMPVLRKRIGKWPYSRQRTLVGLRRAELGYNTLLINERNTSNTCPQCGSRYVHREYGSKYWWAPWLDGASWIQCHDCGSKTDADITGATNMAYKTMAWLREYDDGTRMKIGSGEALRCLVDRLKVQMNTTESGTSA